MNRPPNRPPAQPANLSRRAAPNAAQGQSRLRQSAPQPGAQAVIAQPGAPPVIAQPVRFAAASAVPAGPPVFRAAAAPVRRAAAPAPDGPPSGHAAPPAEPVARRIDDALAIAERLIAVLRRENDLLRRHQSRGLSELIDEKTALARIYETRVRALQDAPPAKGEVDDHRKQALRDAAARLEAAVTENTRLLNAALMASQTVVNLIAEAVRESAPQTKAYSAAGQQRAGTRVAAKHAPSLSLDQTL